MPCRWGSTKENREQTMARENGCGKLDLRRRTNTMRHEPNVHLEIANRRARPQGDDRLCTAIGNSKAASRHSLRSKEVATPEEIADLSLIVPTTRKRRFQSDVKDATLDDN